MMTAKQKKPNTISILLLLTAAALAGTVLFGVLFHSCAWDIFLTLHISFLTIFYHFFMRILVAAAVTAYGRSRGFSPDAAWYRPRRWEAALYRRLRVKRWKTKLITARPEQFDIHRWSYADLLRNMTQAELGHTLMMALSFVPLLWIPTFGAAPVFLITSILACAMDAPFVMIQRYNRPRVQRLMQQAHLHTK